LSRLSEVRLTEVRRERICFVFQAYNLLDSLTVERTSRMPLRLAERQGSTARYCARCSPRSGLGDTASAADCELSGGQQQRVAMPAR